MLPKYVRAVWAVAFGTLLCAASPASAQTVGAAQSFSILGGAGVNANGSGSVVNGDVGINPAAATFITGFPANASILPPFANHGNDGSAIAASGDVVSLFNSSALAPAGGLVTGADLSISGPTANGVYPPGKYFVSVGTAIIPGGGTVTLNGAGLYIFTVNSDLTTAVTATINFVGVDPCNVWWRVPTQATINNPAFPGNVVSNAGVALGSSAHLFGRALTTAPGIITLAGGNTINSCTSPASAPVPTLPPAFVVFLALGLTAVGYYRLRRRNRAA